MTLKEAIKWANYLARPRWNTNYDNKYYVCKWNNEYCVYTESQAKRCPEIKKEAVYITNEVH